MSYIPEEALVRMLRWIDRKISRLIGWARYTERPHSVTAQVSVQQIRGALAQIDTRLDDIERRLLREVNSH